MPAAGDIATAWGGCLDAQLTGDIFGALGEVWMGQAAGTHFMAALQSLNPNIQPDDTLLPTPIRSFGGWGELYVQPVEH